MILMENSYYVKNWENRISGSKSNFSELLAKSVHLDLSYMWKEMFWTIKENSYCAEKCRNESCLSSNSTLIFCLNLFTRNPFLIKILLFLKWGKQGIFVSKINTWYFLWMCLLSFLKFYLMAGIEKWFKVTVF